METITKTKQSSEISKHVIWDCDSSLYDSFELKAFEKQLDSALASRTLSMPHLSDRRLPPPVSKKPKSKILQSVNRLIRSVFKNKNDNKNESNGYKNNVFGGEFVKQSSKEGFYVIYDKSGTLSTIPEVPEFDGLSPDIKSLVKRTASDRFTAATSIGIYRA